jgi:hypothetical protein
MLTGPPPLQGATLTGRTVVSVDSIFVSGLMYVILSRSVSRSKLFILGSLKPEDFTPVMPLLGDMSPERVAGLPPQLRAFLEAMEAPAEAQQPPELHSRYKDAVHDQAARSAAVASGAREAAAQAAAAKAIEDTACELCGDTEDAANMLLCDGCDRGYHMRCMGWKRKRAPKGDWYCEECALVG